jgi:hypothetical protein
MQVNLGLCVYVYILTESVYNRAYKENMRVDLKSPLENNINELT